MNVARSLFWLGVIVLIVGVLGNAYTFVQVVSQPTVGYNAANFVVAIFSPLWQGGLLIGIAKILEKLYLKTN